MIRGYARVSTDGQTVAHQVAELRKAGAERIYQETASGAKANRAQLARIVRDLEPGDVLLVCHLDRLGRSTLPILQTLHKIAERGAGFRSLAQTWADTTTPHGRLMVTILSGFAEFERELIVSRTSAGRARALARGVRLGRKPTLTHHQQQEVIKRLEAANESHAEIAASYNVSRWTIGRLAS